MAEGKGFWEHVGEHLFVILVGMVLCGLGSLYWAYFQRPATYVAVSLNSRFEQPAMVKDTNTWEQAKKNTMNCIVDHLNELKEHWFQHLVKGKLVLLDQAARIAKGESCRSELTELESRNPFNENLRTKRDLWTPQEWSQIDKASGFLYATPAAGSSVTSDHKALTARPLSLAEWEEGLKARRISEPTDSTTH